MAPNCMLTHTLQTSSALTDIQIHAMDILMATSRGRGLKSLNKRPNTLLTVYPGGKTEDMTQEALDILSCLPSSKNHLVYFISGLPDVTTKLKKNFYLRRRKRHYEEVIIKDSPSQIHNRVIKIIKSAEKKIKNAKATPVFATICPMSIQRWNSFRLHQHKTSHLNYFNHYDHMQQIIEEAISLINTTILSINSKNKVATPKIAQPIMYLRNGHCRCRYGKLLDGVHPNENIQAEWKNTVEKILTKNRKSIKKAPKTLPPPTPSSAINYEDTDGKDSDASQKRSWLY